MFRTLSKIRIKIRILFEKSKKLNKKDSSPKSNRFANTRSFLNHSSRMPSSLKNWHLCTLSSTSPKWLDLTLSKTNRYFTPSLRIECFHSDHPYSYKLTYLALFALCLWSYFGSK